MKVLGFNATLNNICLENKVLMRPGLAQLVERLAHRYSESTSSNPDNLTSATVCGDRTSCAPAAQCRWISGNVHYVHLRNANKAAHSGFETQRRRHQKSSGLKKGQKL